MVLITIFPYPANYVLTINNNGLLITKISLTNLTRKTIGFYENKTELDLSKIANGIYILILETDEGMVNKKVVLNK